MYHTDSQAVSLDLNVLGRRVLRLVRHRKDRLSLAGDVLVYLHGSTLSQNDVDSLSDESIHDLIRLTVKASKIDRWQQSKREFASTVGEMINEVCDRTRGNDLSDEMTALIERARLLLGRECAELLESGYSIRQIADKLGVSKSTLHDRLKSLRS